MIELPVHTLIGRENREGGLLLCGLNHGYSKEDERQDAAGINRADPHKSFFRTVRSMTIHLETVLFLGFHYGVTSLHEVARKQVRSKGQSFKQTGYKHAQTIWMA